jgi:hypothetical protein
MSTEVPGQPRSTPPAWLIPAGIGMIIALLVALIAVVLTRDNDSAAPATTEAATGTTDSIEPEATIADTTTPEATAPDTTVPATEPATTAPVVEEVAKGQALVVAGSETRRFSVVATCSDFWAGVQTTSHVLVDNSTERVWVVDVFQFEEGGNRGMLAVDMDYAIAANLFGQDTPLSPTYSGEIDDSQAGVARATLQRTSGDGPTSVELALGEPTTADDCAVGWYTPESPYPAGTQVEWLSPDESVGKRFNVLADCGGELLVTGGGLLLTSYPQDGGTMSAGLVNSYNFVGDAVWWTNIAEPQPDETAFDQGGGGDITAAINVYPDGDRTAAPGYLSWTERPLRSAVGAAGLPDDVCTAAP